MRVRAQTLDQFLPTFSSQARGLLFRVHDVAEQNRGQHAVKLECVANDAGQKLFYLFENRFLIADKRKMIAARQFDVLRAGNTIGDVTSFLDL